jgi:hypothetical protein
MRSNRVLKPWLFGIIAGSVFVLAEVFGLYPPSAYSFCLSCHTRDLVNTVLRMLWGRNFQTALVARRVIMITSPAVLLGAFLAAKKFGEHRIQSLSRPVLFFVCGFTVMIIGIVIFGCPTRIILRAGYGELYGIVALVGMLAGIICATLLMRFRWQGRRSRRNDV